MWFDGNRVLTYNCLFNFIVGNRGTGKTYWFKRWAVKDFLENKNEFVYLRRYKSEVNVSKFFEQIAGEFPDTDFMVKGHSFYINGNYAGCAMSLSTGITKKSVTFENVTKIGFDEFIIEEGNYRYIKNEVHAFLDMYETINRLRLERKDTIVFFMANAISLYNPYFTEFGVKFRTGQKKFRKNDIYAEIFYDTEFAEFKKQSRFGKLIAGTDYEAYAVDNSFYLDDETFIEKKHNACNYAFTFYYNGKTYGVWIDFKEGKYYISNDFDKSSKKIYSFTTSDHRPNTLMIKAARNSVAIKGLLDNYKLSNVRFESHSIKNESIDLIKKILI